MGRSLVVAALLIIALIGAGIMAFMVTMNRTDDLDRDTLKLEPLHKPIPTFYLSRQREAPRGSWMPLLPADHRVRVNGALADPTDETFELTFSAYAIPDSIMYACLGSEKKLCFGVGHSPQWGFQRIGWYEAPGKKPLWRWEDAGDDYLSFAVSLRQDGGEMIAKLNGREISRLPADYKAGPVEFYVGYAPVRLDEVVVTTREGVVATRQQPSYRPYAAYFAASFAVLLLFFFESIVWRKLGLDRPGVWIALGYASILIVYAYNPRPLAAVPWLGLIGAIVGTRALSLPLFAQMFEKEMPARREQTSLWEKILTVLPVAVGLLVFLLIGIAMQSMTSFMLFLLSALAIFIIGYFAGLRSVIALQSLWPLVALQLLGHFMESPSLHALGWVLTTMTFCSMMITCGVFHGRYVLRLLVSLAAILMVTDIAIRPICGKPLQKDPLAYVRRYYRGDEIIWQINQDTNLAPMIGKDYIDCHKRKDWDTNSSIYFFGNFGFGRPYFFFPNHGEYLFPRWPYNSYQSLVFFRNVFLPKQKNCRIMILYLGLQEQHGALARLMYSQLKALPVPDTFQELYDNTIEGPRWLPKLLNASAIAHWRWQRQIKIETENHQRALTETTIARRPQNTLKPTNRQVLEEFIDLGREHGIEMIFVPVPTLHGEFYNPYHAGLMREVAQAKGATFVDVREAVRETDDPFLDPRYLTGKAWDAITHELRKVIMPLLKKEKPSSPSGQKGS